VTKTVLGVQPQDELPGGMRAHLVGHANEREIIPAVATSVLEKLQQK